MLKNSYTLNLSGSDNFDNNFGIKNDFTKYLKDNVQINISPSNIFLTNYAFACNVPLNCVVAFGCCEY